MASEKTDSTAEVLTSKIAMHTLELLFAAVGKDYGVAWPSDSDQSVRWYVASALSSLADQILLLKLPWDEYAQATGDAEAEFHETRFIPLIVHHIHALNFRDDLPEAMAYLAAALYAPSQSSARGYVQEALGYAHKVLSALKDARTEDAATRPYLPLHTERGVNADPLFFVDDCVYDAGDSPFHLPLCSECRRRPLIFGEKMPTLCFDCFIRYRANEEAKG
jgi:hypothetical protein